LTLVIVDAENVRRSLWPNLAPLELVDRARAWADREGHDLLIVFDGPPPEDGPDVVGAADADDEIASVAATVETRFWVVTSDRDLRARVGDRAERLVGGGSFAREL
jgi:hypothetical protein